MDKEIGKEKLNGQHLRYALSIQQDLSSAMNFYF